jgi:hypothetical protein
MAGDRKGTKNDQISELESSLKHTLFIRKCTYLQENSFNFPKLIHNFIQQTKKVFKRMKTFHFLNSGLNLTVK